MPDWIDIIEVTMDRLNSETTPCPCCHCKVGITRVALCKVIAAYHLSISEKGALLYYCTRCEHETVEVGIE